MDSFKIGDRVRLLEEVYLEGLYRGGIYKIISVNPNHIKSTVLLSVPEGTQHLHYDGTNPGWWVPPYLLKLEDTQMQFSFMYED